MDSLSKGRLEQSNRYLVEAFQFFCERLPAGTFIELPGLIAAFGNVPVPFFNTMALDSPACDEAAFRRRIQTAVEHGATCTFPWLLVLCTEWIPANATAMCRDSGLVPTMNLTGMVAEELRPPRRPAPELVYDQTKCKRLFDQLAGINCAAYGMPAELGRSIAHPDLWDERTFPVVGYAQGEPVSCSATIVLDDILYVAWVATLPGHQKKGYAEAAMRVSLEAALEETGLTKTWLHASEAGFGLYEAMGYETAGRFVLFTGEPAESS